jgi:hypothetical protein
LQKSTGFMAISTRTIVGETIMPRPSQRAGPLQEPWHCGAAKHDFDQGSARSWSYG